MPDKPGDCPPNTELERAAEIAKDLMRENDVQAVNIWATKEEVEISVKRHSLSAVWAVLWSAAKKIFGAK